MDGLHLGIRTILRQTGGHLGGPKGIPMDRLALHGLQKLPREVEAEVAALARTHTATATRQARKERHRKLVRLLQVYQLGPLEC